MKRIGAIGLLGAVLAVAVGFISANAISTTPFLMAASDLSANESVYMIGHVEYTVRGADGQIKQYIQGDNEIVERGKDCSAQAIFGTGTNTVCTNSGFGFKFIAIGNGTHVGGSETTQLVDSIGNEGCDGISTTGDTCEIQRKQATVTYVVTGPNTQVTITNSADPFTFNHGDNNNALNGEIAITESGLFDDVTLGFAADNLFSIKPISGISVTNADTLSVTWTITLS